MPATRKTKVRKPSQPERRSRPVTGKAVARLRAKFSMSQSEFARLLGVSASTIGNWEKKPGTLGLHARSLDAWDAAKRLTKRQARSRLDGS
jgi:DNA-binding transcriptional regulator YiaG